MGVGRYLASGRGGSPPKKNMEPKNWWSVPTYLKSESTTVGLLSIHGNKKSATTSPQFAGVVKYPTSQADLYQLTPPRKGINSGP